MRVYDASLIAPAIRLFLKDNYESVDPIEWISNPVNIVLQNDRGDLALFEPGIKHIYTGHYYFKSRGRAAITAGHEFLDELFNTCYNMGVVTGLVPQEHLGAKWLSRRLGFTAHGDMELHGHHYELFILTKEEFNK